MWQILCLSISSSILPGHSEEPAIERTPVLMSQPEDMGVSAHSPMRLDYRRPGSFDRQARGADVLPQAIVRRTEGLVDR